jgi:hypothetical protein
MMEELSRLRRLSDGQFEWFTFWMSCVWVLLGYMLITLLISFSPCVKFFGNKNVLVSLAECVSASMQFIDHLPDICQFEKRLNK